MHLIKAELLDISVYIVKFGFGYSVPMLLRNIDNNTVVEYPTMSAAALALGIKTDDNLLVHVIKGTPVVAPDESKYLIEFKSQADRDKGLARYNKRLVNMKAKQIAKKSL
jgi:hypothetical protein